MCFASSSLCIYLYVGMYVQLKAFVSVDPEARESVIPNNITYIYFIGRNGRELFKGMLV